MCVCVCVCVCLYKERIYKCVSVCACECLCACVCVCVCVVAIPVWVISSTADVAEQEELWKIPWSSKTEGCLLLKEMTSVFLPPNCVCIID